jgi:hypothetical protein
MYKAHTNKRFQTAIKQRELSEICGITVHGAFREVPYFREVEFHA